MFKCEQMQPLVVHKSEIGELKYKWCVEREGGEHSKALRDCDIDFCPLSLCFAHLWIEQAAFLIIAAAYILLT